MYDRVADLPLTVDDCTFELRERATSSGFDRATTTVALSGDGETGRGEDVTYTNEAHHALVDHEVDIAGTYTFDEFSDALARAARGGAVSPLPPVGVRERGAGPGTQTG